MKRRLTPNSPARRCPRSRIGTARRIRTRPFMSNHSAIFRIRARRATFVRGAVGSGLAITTTSMPAGTVGSPYSASLNAQGGTPPYTWSVIAGSLPAGLTLNPATGAITGTPTGAGTSFTVKVTDSTNPSQSGTQALSIAISGSSSTYSIASSPSGLTISVDGVSYTARPGTKALPGRRRGYVPTTT